MGADLRQEIAAMGADLRQEMAAMRADLRLEIAGLGASLRQEMSERDANLRQEMAFNRFELLKWCFIFWVGQAFTIAGLFAVLMRVYRP